MNIVAATQKSVFEAALVYAETGFSVLPTRGKQPAIQWAELQTKRAAFSHIHNWNRAGLLGGIGIVCGAISGGLVVIDLDGLEAVSHFEIAFPELLDTYTVLSGSGKGKHLYFLPDELPPTTRTKGYELRADGCYVVAPPSVHPDSKKPYAVVNPVEIKRVDHLRGVVQWITGMIEAKQPARVASVLPAINETVYGGVALSGECDKVARSANHVNDELNRAAFKLGRLVQRGILDYGQCESALMIAARHLSARDGERATLRTIKSGLDAGIQREKVGVNFKNGR